MITGVATPWPRMRSSTSNPSMSGNPTSRMINEKLPCTASVAPISPEGVVSEVNPADFNPLAMNPAILGSSSMINMLLTVVVPSVREHPPGVARWALRGGLRDSSESAG